MGSTGIVDHQQMMANIVVLIKIAALCLYFGVRLPAHFLAEDTVTQMLRCGYFSTIFGQTHGEITGIDRGKYIFKNHAFLLRL